MICHSENLRVPHSYTDRKGIDRMKADFIAQAESYRYYDRRKGYIGEHVLAFTDMDKIGAAGEVDPSTGHGRIHKAAGNRPYAVCGHHAQGYSASARTYSVQSGDVRREKIR